ncbi:Polysaccharide deacetylase [Granulicella pectinivorans]|jgi:peptidoglycan/xylan/chitin deacetylase (PgdA/CDA1 family)|uniref:Polysaccharide deacetylase n=1 Tax=Granulicella pectinivorans TaxID=474950 RepID=A0A1I6LM69_9BACT|nr:polysaccharide deacetylase family protein [Granulicella pectinivorans]SFS04657.1 Polysaccharide deacetylase [Granulicella pectinivorans]
MLGIAGAVAGVAVAAGGLGTYGALSAGSQLFGQTLIAGNDPNEVALTFDDGPNGDTTMRLLDVLARHQAKATFFVIGGFVKQQPEVVRAIRAAGHIVGNHTMTHPWLHIQTHARIREELAGCNKVIEDVLGEPVRYFRAPHGARRPYVVRYARELGMVPVQWNVIVGDWNPYTARVLEERVKAGIRRAQRSGKSTNVVLHDGWDRVLGGADRLPTVEMVDTLLTRCAERRIRMVGVDAWG